MLACDGLWDVLNADQAVDLIKNYLEEGGSRSSVATMLVNHAKEGGSSDNISVVVVYLDAHRKEVTVKNAILLDEPVTTEQDDSYCDNGQECQSGGSETNTAVNAEGSPKMNRKSTPVCTVNCEEAVSDMQNGVVDAGTIASPKELSPLEPGSPKSTKPTRNGSNKGKMSPKGSPRSKQRTSPSHLDVKTRSVRSKSAPEITPLS